MIKLSRLRRRSECPVCLGDLYPTLLGRWKCDECDGPTWTLRDLGTAKRLRSEGKI